MNVIIRLQNLPWSANAADIRQFFKGLQIPEGGVHIVGGENGDSFIAFSTDEDARQAMALNHGKIKDTKISLLLSSRAEMQKVIEKARSATMYMNSKPAAPITMPDAFNNQYKKVPDASLTTPIMGNYVQQQPQTLMGFPVKSDIPGLGVSAQVMNPSAAATIPMFYAMNNQPMSIEYLAYLNATGMNIDAKKLSELQQQQLQLQQKQSIPKRVDPREERYRRNRSSSHERDRSRSPNDEGSRRRKSRFSAPDKQAAANQVVPSIQQNMNVIQKPASNSIWDIPPLVNSYSSYNGNGNNANIANNYSTNITARSYQTIDKKSTSPITTSSSSFGNIGTCVKVANVDKETTYGDISKFFGSSSIGNNDIKFLNGENGKFSGVVFIRFLSSDAKKQAMTKNGWQLKSTQVMITSISEEDFESGHDPSKMRKRSYDDHPRRDRYTDRYIRDRSNSRDRERERDRDRDREGSRERYQRGGNSNRHGSRGRHNSREHSQNSRGNFRNDYRREYDDKNERNKLPKIQEEKVEYQPDEDYTVLIIDDIPSSNEKELFDAFANITSVTIDKYTAYCKFKSHDDAKAVLEDRFSHYIKNKRVFLEQGSEAQFNDLVKKYGKFDNPEFRSSDEPVIVEDVSSESTEVSQDRKYESYESRDPRQRSQNGNGSRQQMNQNLRTDCILIKNLSPNSKIEDVEKFFSDVNIHRSAMRTHILLDKRGEPCGDAFVEFKYENDMQQALTKNNLYMGSSRLQIMPIPREQVNAVLNSFGGDSNQNSRPANRDWAPPSDFGSPGCVVMLSNLCYRASVDDILKEFSEFDLTPDQLIRRFNDMGQPTGNACINFNSPEDAAKACDQFNKVKILNRPVWLKRVL